MSSRFDPTPYIERHRAAVAGTVAAPMLQPEHAGDGGLHRGAARAEPSPAGDVASVAAVAGVADLGLPNPWRVALAKLAAARPPRSVERWRQIQSDALTLATRFGAVADRFGWDVVSVFGYHPEYDDVGLVLQMRGRPVVAMASGEAIIRTGDRSWHICRPHVPDGTVLLWRWEEADPHPP